MGAQLAKAAMQPHWAVQLDYAARVVLTHMALTALDYDTAKNAARLYFGGYKGIILALTGTDPDNMNEDEYRRAFERVKKIIQRLVKAGAITITQRATNGTHSCYEIHPDRFDGATK